jgi:TolA-binding protein
LLIVPSAEYKIGNIYYFQELWDDAKKCFERALKIFLVENSIHPTTSATQLKLATIALKQGQVEEAM